VVIQCTDYLIVAKDNGSSGECSDSICIGVNDRQGSVLIVFVFVWLCQVKQHKFWLL
jgi:hypothetical protein